LESFSISGQPPEPQTLDARIAAGDPAAEEELVARFSPRIRAFVASRAAGRDFAEEVVQDTMMALICTLREGRLRESDNLPALAYGIARNRLADAIRKHARRRTVPFPEDFDCPAPAAEQDPELVSAARTQIETLEPADRRILWMTLIDGFKPAEVAKAIGMSADAVRQRKSRALKRLVEHLKPLSRFGRDPRLTGQRPK
jgi:RNA polymerase sigma factor (sigma-70 family)